MTNKILDYVGKFMDVAVVNNGAYEDEGLMVAEPKEKYAKESR